MQQRIDTVVDASDQGDDRTTTSRRAQVNALEKTISRGKTGKQLEEEY